MWSKIYYSISDCIHITTNIRSINSIGQQIAPQLGFIIAFIWFHSLSFLLHNNNNNTLPTNCSLYPSHTTIIQGYHMHMHAWSIQCPNHREWDISTLGFNTFCSFFFVTLLSPQRLSFQTTLSRLVDWNDKNSYKEHKCSH